MNIVDRFIAYTRIDTTSRESDICPSSRNQFLLARILLAQMRDLGLTNTKLDDNCFVYGTLESNLDHESDVFGLMAHMDTSNATSGEGIRARVIENYDGKDIELSEGIFTKVEDYPELKSLVGKSLIVTDGTTLLGGDDKAGIAVIMDLLQYYYWHPEAKHGTIKVCFSPDEETGTGIHNIDLNEFKCDFAYTVDGGEVSDIAYECFNGAFAKLTFNGNSIHPGSAKNKMINAVQLAVDFHNALPVFDRPEFTEGREGFNHCVGMEGNCQKAEAVYIIRNHDSRLFEKQKATFERIKDDMNFQYGKEVCVLEMADTYHNMAQQFVGKEYIIDIAKKAIEKHGYTVTHTPIRGGTDGAQLSFKGLPTPNLGCGDRNCHGNHEFVIIDEMKAMVEILKDIALEVGSAKR